MSFQESISVCFKKYFDFEGRASKSEFWYFYLLIVIVLFVAGFSLGMLLPTDESYDTLVIFVVYLPLLIPAIAVTARRIHDFGRSGWMQCIFLPGFIVAEILNYNAAGWVVYIATLILFVVYVNQKSDRRKNKFGPVPKK
jgi:uncharacterized membrane protein YhaH (DUF805 family)|tara:strand:- start:18 stop:437 length:420 start_codon:yes stop_codon:yes gene_type:complete